ncbi:saccharopine dehydrogenase family protein [Alicycliphilus denitrificans]|uniref:saccharopine dehydrogenase family protein n=1 Tax=Alicycliphilus denitrificans TaxID=179636 RepID=UPI0038515419
MVTPQSPVALTDPRPVLVLGAGHIGQAITLLLSEAGGYALQVADRNLAALEQLRAACGVATVHVPDAVTLESAIAGRYAVLNALPFHQAVPVATLCARLGVHYLDLTEDVASTQAIRALADGARCVLMPQCGLAPGFIGIVGNDLARRLDSAQALHLRVGALPRYPQGALRYSLTWSTEGLINEYCNPCEAIIDGQLAQVPALDGLETLLIDGVEYEAFHTSGGLGTLPRTWEGRIGHLEYKTIRYPGHRAAMHLLLHELRLRERRGLLKELLEDAVAATRQDVIVILASASGLRSGRLVQESYSARILGRQLSGGQWLSAIQHTTAASICAALDLVASGRLAPAGFVQQESIALADFLANRFGRVYDVEGAGRRTGA